MSNTNFQSRQEKGVRGNLSSNFISNLDLKESLVKRDFQKVSIKVFIHEICMKQSMDLHSGIHLAQTRNGLNVVSYIVIPYF